MNKLIIAILIVLFLIIVAAPILAMDKNEIHVVVFAREPNTEVALIIDGETYTEIVNPGINCITHEIKKPTLSYLIYGDKYQADVKKTGTDSDDYYAVIFLPDLPGESVGE